MEECGWNEAEGRVERAHDLYKEGRWAEAAAELQAAIDVNPYNSSWYFNLALTLEAMDDQQSAHGAYEAAIKLAPDDTEVLNCSGVNLTSLGRYEDALRIFERIEEMDPAFEPSYCNRIVVYTEMGDYENAELMFYLARLFKDKCPLCYYNVGSTFHARGDHDKAIDCWRQTLKLDPAHREAHVRIAESYWAKGDLDIAGKHYQAELLLNTRDVETLLDLGELNMERDALSVAASNFRRAIDISPNHAGAHFCLGELALRRKHYPQALEFFQAVTELDKEFPGAQAKIGETFIRIGKHEQAARHLMLELKRCRDDVATLQDLGRLFLEIRLAGQANAVLSHLVQLQPDNALVHHNLAVSCFMLDKLDEGIGHCHRALKIKPEYSLALYNLALAHLQKGQSARAKRYVERALTIAPEDKQVLSLAKRMGMRGWWVKIQMRFKGSGNDELAK